LVKDTKSRKMSEFSASPGRLKLASFLQRELKKSTEVHCVPFPGQRPVSLRARAFKSPVITMKGREDAITTTTMAAATAGAV